MFTVGENGLKWRDMGNRIYIIGRLLPKKIILANITPLSPYKTP
jgi:hypothetical protein